MKPDKQELYQATQTLYSAFSYLQPRMQDSRELSQSMNAETLAGCVLHACLATLLDEIRRQRERPRADLAA